MNPVARPWRALLPSAVHPTPGDPQATHGQHCAGAATAAHDRDAAAEAHVRHAKQLHEIDRYGESLRRMRRTIDAAHAEGRAEGQRVGWRNGARWGFSVGALFGVALMWMVGTIVGRLT